MNPPKRSALDDAVRLLARRGHSRLELSQKLKRRGHPSSCILRAFERLQDLGYLEAERDLALRYASELATRPGITPRAATIKLRGRGFDDADIKEAIEEAFREWDAREAALQAVHNEKNPSKAARMLTRRGFSSDAIGWVVSRLRAVSLQEETVE